MDGISAAASIIAIVDISVKIASLCYQYSAAVKEAKSDIEHVQRKVSDIAGVLGKVGQLLDGRDKARLSTSYELCSSLNSCLQELKGIKEKLEPGRTHRTMSRFGVRALKWPFTSKQIDKIISSLEGFEQTFTLALQVDQTDLMLNIDQKLDLIKLPTAQGASFNSHMEEHNAKCLPDTRIELLHQIEDWAKNKDSKPIFWLSGMAGTGKSTIARTIAQSFANKGQLGASFFFKKGESERGNASRFFTTIATDLLACEPGMMSGIRKALRTDPVIPERTLKDQFEKLILGPLLEIQQAHPEALVRIVVIDALDECEQEEDIRAILRLLARTKDIRPLSLRVLVTSRPELPIRLGFEQMADGTYQDVALHEVPKSIVEHDIRLFLEHELREVREKRLLSQDWPKTEQIQALVELAVPLFIFAATVCRYISTKGGDPEEYLNKVLKYRKSTFSQLDRTYLPVLDQLLAEQEEEDKEMWLRAFRELVGSIILLESPLSINSLANLLQIPQKQVRYRLDSLHSVLSIPNSADIPIRLLHLSFREFLVDPRKQGKSPFWANQRDIHKKLAFHCLELMSNSGGLRQDMCNLLRPGVQRNEIDEGTVASSLPPELQYACRYWVHHLEQSEQHVRDGESTHLFLQEHFLHWLEAMSLMGYISDSIASIDILLCLVDEHESVDVSSFLVDARRFILTNRSILDTAPLQIYSSSLIFVPKLSVIRVCFEQCIPKWVRHLPNVESKWGAHIQTLEGHSSSVSSIAYSLNSKHLASASRDTTIRLWDAATGRPLLVLEGHQRWVRSVTFSPDCKQLASASDDRTVRLWDTTTGESLRTLEGHTKRIMSVAYSPDGKQLASASEDKSIQIWEVATGQPIQTLDAHKDPVRSVVFSPDGRQLASASDDCTIRLWDALNWQPLQLLEDHGRPITSVAYSPDGKQLASASEDKNIRIWEVATGQPIQTLDAHKDSVRLVVFSPNGKCLASASNDWTIRLWGTMKWQSLQLLEGHSYKVSSIAFSRDGRRLVSSSADTTVRIWDTTVEQSPQMVKEHRGYISSIALSPDGKLLASASHDRTVRLWDVVTGQSTQTLHGHKALVDLVIFSPDGKQLASISHNTIQLWDAVGGRLLRMLEWYGQNITSVTFSPEGEQLASGSNDKTAQLWDIGTGVLLQLFEGHSKTVTFTAFSPDSKQIASTSDDKTIRLWEKRTGQLLQTFKGHHKTVERVAFSLDGKQLASISKDETIRLWDIATGQQLQTFESYGNTTELHFTTDNASLVTQKGILRLNIPCNERCSTLQYTPRHITLSGNWISINGEDRIWLPNQHRGTCSVVSMNRLIIGQRSGQIHFWKFDLESSEASAEM